MMWAIEFKLPGEYWQEEDYCTDLMIAVAIYIKCVKDHAFDESVEVRLVQIVAGSTKG